jgi:hypothetical protein
MKTHCGKLGCDGICSWGVTDKDKDIVYTFTRCKECNRTVYTVVKVYGLTERHSLLGNQFVDFKF